MKKAVILLSGGLDSTTTLFYAQKKGFSCHALIFDYGQRHKKEIALAKKIAQYAKCPVHCLKISLPWGGSSLIDTKLKVEVNRDLECEEIPLTYVPGRNIIFLSYAASFAETIGAQDIFIGANAVDYSGYPDCRPVFMKAFNQAILKGLKVGDGGGRLSIKTPLINKTKSQIIKLGLSLDVPYQLTWSCYQGGSKPCRKCDSCRLRQKGFDEINRKDPLC